MSDYWSSIFQPGRSHVECVAAKHPKHLKHSIKNRTHNTQSGYEPEIIIIICQNWHSFLYMAGCLIGGIRRWSVTYTYPRGLGSSECRIWYRRAFQERKPYQFPGRMKKNSPYYCPGRGGNPRPPAHPGFITNKGSHTLLVSAKGRQFL